MGEPGALLQDWLISLIGLINYLVRMLNLFVLMFCASVLIKIL